MRHNRMFVRTAAVATAVALVGHMIRTIRTAAASRHVSSLVALLAPAVVATSSGAQDKPIGVELRPFVGAYVPTGRHADLLRSGALVGFQGARELNHFLSVVGTVAWLPNEDRTTSFDAAVDLYTYDLGAEVGSSKSLWTGAVLRPFVGLGIGGRSFGYRNREPQPQHDLTGYAALGGQLRAGRVGRRRVDLRVEARGYATGFKGLTGELGRTERRTDVTIATGLAVAL
jgi:hypothetical protein